MGISNVSSGLRSGVCTSTTRPSAPYEGQMIFETDTHRVLVWDNAAWVMIADTDTPPALQKITSGTFSGLTSGSPLDVNSVFSSEFTNYLVNLRVSQSSTTGSTVIRMRTASSLESSAVYNYSWGGSYVAAGPGYNWNLYSTTNPFSPDTLFWTGMTPASGYSATSRIEIHSPNVARETRFIGQGFTNWTGTYYNVAVSGTGEVGTATQYTGFRLYPTAGSITGEYFVYGIRD